MIPKKNRKGFGPFPAHVRIFFPCIRKINDCFISKPSKTNEIINTFLASYENNYSTDYNQHYAIECGIQVYVADCDVVGEKQIHV